MPEESLSDLLSPGDGGGGSKAKDGAEGRGGAANRC